MPGVYIIKNTLNGRVYVGSAVQPSRRWREHQSGLHRRTHRNEKLQHAWNKYGAASFVFVVIENVESPTDLLEREQHWIDALSAASRDNYNILPIAGNRLGAKASPETIEKLRLSHIGQIRSREASARAAASNRGKKRTPEQRERIAASRRGKPFTDEHRRRIGEAGLGREVSVETRQKISAFNKGKILSQEHREKIAASKTGLTIPPAVRAKISATKLRRASLHD
jgi:group I intron endonuclease